MYTRTLSARLSQNIEFKCRIFLEQLEMSVFLAQLVFYVREELGGTLIKSVRLFFGG